MSAVTLQSKDHRDLLDIIDALRSKGFSRYVDLPEIIVCGDQSAGKSSVLEAISGMSFPTKDNLCTRFATELVLRRDGTYGVKVSIIPGPERSTDERERLGMFQAEIDIANPDLGSIVDKAKDAMGLSDTKVFGTDTLRVELCGPDQPHLTLVDLPGLFRAGNKEQSVGDAAIVRKMVHDYMKRPRSIILAVVSAKSDFSLQEVTELTRKLDPKGLRTLGLITKPDTLDTGSDSERSYLKLAQNKDVSFRLGWHVLKNRSYEMRDASSTERDAAEDEFFAKGIWTNMDPAHLGVKTLKPRLSTVLKDQILRQLPSLLQDVQSGISECRTRLERLGVPRTNGNEQRRYLVRLSREFSTLIKAAVDGVYHDPFFGNAKTEEGYQKRLRAVVQNNLIEFKENMHSNGEYRTIIDTPIDNETLPSGKISRVDYQTEVIDLMTRSRGRELLGTFNPLIIGELFTEQCQPWRKIVIETKEVIIHKVYVAARAILEHIAVDETTEGIFRLVSRLIDDLKGDLDQTVTDLLDPYYKVHPITYNHYLTDNVQKAQATRRQRKFEAVIQQFFAGSRFGSMEERTVTRDKLRALFEEGVETNMERHASDTAIDYMQAYYKVRNTYANGYLEVALKNIIDDVSTLAIEQRLIQKLPTLFDPETVYDMKEKEIASLTAESKETAAERTWCTEKLAILEAGLLSLKHFDKHQLHLEDDEHTKEIDSPSNSLTGILSPNTPIDSRHTETTVLQSDNEEEAFEPIVIPAKHYEKEDALEKLSQSPKKSKKDKKNRTAQEEQGVDEEQDTMWSPLTKVRKGQVNTSAFEWK